jgi:hypothetical protein
VDTAALLTAAVLIASAGRALQLHRDWVRHGLTWFDFRYLLGVMVGNLLLAVVSQRLSAPVATLTCVLIAGFYGLMIGSKLSALMRTRLARIVHESRRLNMRTPTTAREWLRANSFYFIATAHRLATRAHEKLKGF